jgi:hypothetical protein
MPKNWRIQHVSIFPFHHFRFFLRFVFMLSGYGQRASGQAPV